jgi:hypothetical protein
LDKQDRIITGNKKGILSAFNPLSGERNILWNSPEHKIITGATQGKNIFLNSWTGCIIQWNPEAVRIWNYNIPEQYTSHTPIPLDKEVLLPCWNGIFLSFPLEK